MESTTYIYKHASGVDVPAAVYFPISSPATTSKARPIALLFHPGGFVLGSSAMIPQSQIRALVNMGFVVVTPEYRLCPQASLYEGPIQDAKDCLVWAQEKLPALLEEDGAGAGEEEEGEGKRVKADGGRVVVAGYSCGGNLALHLATVPNPPKAILAFYPTIYFDSPLYHTPFAPFANIPTPPPAFLEAVHTGAQALTSAPMFAPNGKPNLDTPRTAWMLDALKNGTHLSSCVQDGKFARCDPATLFASAGSRGKWPPTCFVHGTEDVFALEEWSWRAKSELEEAGTGDVEVVRVEGAGHVFDILLKEGDELFEGPVMEGLKFLEQRA